MYRRQLISMSIVLVAFMGLSLPLFSQTNFAYSKSLAWGSYFGVVCAADVVGSSADDIILAFSGSNAEVRIRTYDGSAAETVIPIPGTFNVNSCDTADLNGDGQRDIALLGVSSSNLNSLNLTVLRRVGTTWQVSYFPVATPGVRVFLVDVDADGDRDAVCGATILSNDGAGAFSSSMSLPLPVIPFEGVGGDFDGDGDVDLVLATIVTVGASQHLWICPFELQGATGWVALAPFIAIPKVGVEGIEVGDLNSDGRDDLLVQGYLSLSQSPGYIDESKIQVLLGEPGLAFIPLAPYQLSFTLTRGQLHDIDGDDDLDYVGSGPAPIVMLNDGAGLFLPSSGNNCSAGDMFGGPWEAPIVADVDGNGESEIFYRSYYENSEYLLDVALYRYTRIVPPPSGTATITTITPFGSYPLPLQNVGRFRVRVVASSGFPAFGKVVGFQLNPGSTNARLVNSDGPTLVAASASTRLYDYPSESLALVAIDAGNISGTAILTAVLDSGTSVNFPIAVGTLTISLSIAQGNSQVSPPGSPFSIPLVVRVDLNGNPYPSQNVQWVVGAGSPVTLSASNSLTNSAGEASITVTAGPNAGPASVIASFGGSSITFSLSIGNQIAIVDGNQQFTMTGQPFATPLTVRVVDSSGQPAAGVPVAFTATQNSVTLSPASVTTDAQGLAATSAIVAPGFRGAVAVHASSSAGAVDFSLYVRGLALISPGPTTRIFTYAHGRPAVPLALMFDQPLAPPGFVSTPFGSVATSIINPQPTLYVIDGIGWFGPFDSTMNSGTGVMNRLFTNLPNYGLTFVAQVLFWDASQPLPAAIGLSNPVTFNL